MIEEVKGRVFDPFFTTKGTAGLGLGLSESYRIVERHFGNLDVESQPDFGTTFTVTLPVIIFKSVATKRETVEKALALMVRLEGQKEIRKLRGKIKWEGDIDAWRRD